MSDKWTKGPWECKRARIPADGEFDWCVAAEIDGNPHVIIEAFGRVAENVRPNAEANARLISAAPDMAEALWKAMLVEIGLRTSIHMAEACKHGAPIPENIEWPQWFIAARAALAKARGEQTCAG